MEIKQFKIRCSAIGEIMSAKGELTQTNKTWLDIWMKEQIYNRKKEFTSKYTDKGNIMEDHAIDFVAEKLNLGLAFKNDREFENDYLTGTPDLIFPDKNLIIDIKCSWDCFTFPLFGSELPNKDYYYQAQGYMELANIDNYKVAYVLIDTPSSIIEREAWYLSKNSGFDFEETLEELERKLTYNDVTDPVLKLKTFNVERNRDVVDNIYRKVDKCREYIKDNLFIFST
ncbi:MAG: hypothetical protein LBE91_19020 [Tannerella sp.]|jgi:hypothetical protein|nr:hypothetical protein [Tannerella sp.]